MGFGTILREAAQRHSDSVAVSCEDHEQTYAELFQRACQLAQGLQLLGLSRGDRVATLGPTISTPLSKSRGWPWADSCGPACTDTSQLK